MGILEKLPTFRSAFWRAASYLPRRSPKKSSLILTAGDSATATRAVGELDESRKRTIIAEELYKEYLKAQIGGERHRSGFWRVISSFFNSNFGGTVILSIIIPLTVLWYNRAEQERSRQVVVQKDMNDCIAELQYRLTRLRTGVELIVREIEDLKRMRFSGNLIWFVNAVDAKNLRLIRMALSGDRADRVNSETELIARLIRQLKDLRSQVENPEESAISELRVLSLAGLVARYNSSAEGRVLNDEHRIVLQTVNQLVGPPYPNGYGNSNYVYSIQFIGDLDEKRLTEVVNYIVKVLDYRNN